MDFFSHTRVGQDPGVPASEAWQDLQIHAPPLIFPSYWRPLVASHTTMDSLPNCFGGSGSLKASYGLLLESKSAESDLQNFTWVVDLMHLKLMPTKYLDDKLLKEGRKCALCADTESHILKSLMS